MLAVPPCQEEASKEDLLEDQPEAPLPDVSKARHRCPSLCTELGPLLQILEGQTVQEMFFAAEEREELEVRLGTIADDRAWGFREVVPTLRRPILEQPEAPINTFSNSDLPQSGPRDAFAEVGTDGLVFQTGGSDGHIARAPCDVGQATVAHIARAEVLEVPVNARGTLVLSTTVTSACHDVITVEAQTAQLLLEDPTYVNALFAGAVHDV